MYQVLDAEMLKNRFIEDLDVLRVFMQSFLHDLERDLKDLESAIAKDSKEKVFFYSHKIKGAIAIFQIDEITIDLVSLQNNSNLNVKDMKDLFKKMNLNFDLLRADIRFFLKKEFNQKTKNILLIDDNSTYLKMQSDLLQKRGFSVLSEISGSDVVECIKTNEIKVVLLDIIMPDVDGLTVLKNIRSSFSKEQVSVIMLTSVEDQEIVKKCQDLGANEFLNKTATIDLIALRVNLQFIALEHNFVLSKYQFLEEEHRQLKSFYQELNSPLMTLELRIEELESSASKIDKNLIGNMAEAYHRIEAVMAKIRNINDISEDSKI